MSGEWLDTGHGADAAKLPTVFASGGQVMARSPQGSRTPRRLPAAIVITAVMVLGFAGAALAIRESLFPTLGSATSRSVWQNPAPPASTTLPARPLAISTSTTSAPSPSSTGGPAAMPAPTPPSTSDGQGAGESNAGSDDSGHGSEESVPASTGAGSGTSGSEPPGSAPDDDSSHDNSGPGSGDSGSGNSGAGSGDDVADVDDTD